MLGVDRTLRQLSDEAGGIQVVGRKGRVANTTLKIPRR